MPWRNWTRKNGAAVGVADAATLLTEIPNKVQTTTGILVDVELTTENGADLVTVRVAPHTQPISYRGEYYYRSGATNQKLTGPALSRFILEKMNVSWDGVTTQRVSLADLDASAIAAWRRRALRNDRVDTSILEESDEDLLRKLEFIQDGELTNAAVLLFHPEPNRKSQPARKHSMSSLPSPRSTSQALGRLPRKQTKNRRTLPKKLPKKTDKAPGRR